YTTTLPLAARDASAGSGSGSAKADVEGPAHVRRHGAGVDDPARGSLPPGPRERAAANRRPRRAQKPKAPRSRERGASFTGRGLFVTQVEGPFARDTFAACSPFSVCRTSNSTS